jgi:hypothetical protein
LIVAASRRIFVMRTRIFLPRPEYPRPDRQRAFLPNVEWLNLNGAWDFRFDPDATGVEAEWFRPGDQEWPDQIIVPFCWESLAAWGEADAAGNDNYFARRVYRNPVEVTSFNYRSAPRYEIGWYRRFVTIPANDFWRGKRVILHIGAADFFTDGWCNGISLGRNEGGFSPFEFDITDALKRDSANALCGTIVLRVEDRQQNTDQPVGKQWGWYSSASGIWQTVFIEPRSPTFIRHFEVITDIASAEASFRIFVTGGTSVLLNITAPDGKAVEGEFAIEQEMASGRVALAPVVLWDPNDPQIYRFTLSLNDGDIPPDVVHSYFGMRSLSAQPVADFGAPAALALNGEPIYLRGALYQSYHPEGVYTAGDVRSIKNDILQAKRAGFDLLRIHIKVDDPLVLYYADTLGILLMADFPNFGEGGDTPTGRRRYEEMMRRTVQRDFNHPSIVAWCLFNETWGFGGQTEFVKLINPSPPRLPSPETIEQQEDAPSWVRSMWQLAKALDPTRLVEDMSVVAWEHLQFHGHGQTDVNSWHFYTSDYEKARRQIHEVVEKTYTGSPFNYVPGYQQGSQPLINSEYGGVGALDGDIDTSWSFKFLTNELRRHGKISAYIYTELHDVEWERNGFLNYDRTPKDFGYDPSIVNQGDVLPIDAPPISRRQPGENISVPVYSSHFSRTKRDEVKLQWKLSGVDSLGRIRPDLVDGQDNISFAHLRVEPARVLHLRLPEETMLCTLWVRAFIPDGTLVASNFIQFFVDGQMPARRDSASQTILRLDAHSWSKAEWRRGHSSRPEAEKYGAAHGHGRGFFEWKFPITDEDVGTCSRLTFLCEASSFRPGSPQTDAFAHATAMRILINDVPAYDAVLPNHPHDARGALSYLRGNPGAYGYLAHATLEGEVVRHVMQQCRANHVRVRCLVPGREPAQGGLAIYSAMAGRYPLGPTLLLDRA